MLLPLDVANELLQLSDLRIEYLLEELWGEFLGDGKFVGPLHRLVEVLGQAKRAELERPPSQPRSCSYL